MKIGIISNLYPPFIRGGAELVAAMQAEGLKKAWQHVFVVSSRPASLRIYKKVLFNTGLWGKNKDEINGVDVYSFNPVNLYYYLDDYKYPVFIRLLWHIIDIFNLFSYFSIKKILLAEKPDLIITHNLMGIGFLVPKLVRKLSASGGKIKHIHIVHDLQLVTPSGLIVKNQENSFSHKFFRTIGYPKLLAWLMGSPDIVISPSKFLLDFYMENKFFEQSKKIVLANPIRSLIRIDKKPTPNLELIYLGQIHKAKGILELIKSFQKIKLPHIRLHVVGLGQDLSKAKDLAKTNKRIIFHGWLANDKLAPLLSQMDVMLVPSLCYENSPTVIYESLSMGIPVLAAEIGGVAELIKEGINGWVFPAGDYDAMVKKIGNIYAQRDKIKLMTDNCYLSVANSLIDKYTQNLLKIINPDD